jgi:hypothetical protein
MIANGWAQIVGNQVTKVQKTFEARPQGVSLEFRYDEGKGRFEDGVEYLRVIAGPKVVFESKDKKNHVEYAAKGLEAFLNRQEGEDILFGNGIENGKVVDVREKFTILPDRLTILKETRISGQEPMFTFRNQYVFTKDPI